jgi:predicted RecA/RadA family phage recombinase
MQAEYLTGNPVMAPYTPGADLDVGTVIVIGNVCRIAHAELKNAIKTDLACGGGVYRVAKATGGGTAIADGKQLYWDDTNNVVTETVGANKKFGVSVSAAADADGYLLAHHQGNV